MSGKGKADHAAAASGLGSRVGYHRRYRMLPLRLIPLLALLLVVAAALFGVPDKIWAILLLVVVFGAITAYVLVPVQRGVKSIGVYAGGVVLVAAGASAGTSQLIAIPWRAMSRVTYKPQKSHTDYAGATRRSTVHVEYALTQLWLRAEDAPVTLAHVWRHRRLFRSIKASIAAAGVSDVTA